MPASSTPLFVSEFESQLEGALAIWRVPATIERLSNLLNSISILRIVATFGRISLLGRRFEPELAQICSPFRVCDCVDAWTQRGRVR